MGLRLDGYSRVSRVGGREGEGYISPNVRRDAINAYARDLYCEVVAWHDRQDFSGENVERPGFQRVLERLPSGETDGVVVMRINRFARSVPDGASIVREIDDRGQVFASCQERIDPRTRERKYMLTSFLANAERGVHIGPTPVGYTRAAKSQPLVPDPFYGPAISELFKRAATRHDVDTALARWMTEHRRAETRRLGGRPRSDAGSRIASTWARSTMGSL